MSISRKSIRRRFNNLGSPVKSTALKYLENKTNEFLDKVIKYSVEQTRSQNRIIVTQEDIENTLNKLDLILKIYPKR